MKNNFLSFVKKESLHILRDRRTMLIVVLIPVVLMVLFGFAISTEVNDIKVAAVAPGLKEYLVPKCEAHAPHCFCTESRSRSCGRHPLLSDLLGKDRQ